MPERRHAHRRCRPRGPPGPATPGHSPWAHRRSTLGLPRVFRAPASMLVSFSAIGYAGPVPTGPEQGSHHDRDRFVHADTRRPALPSLSPHVAGSQRFRTGSAGRRLVAPLPRSLGGTSFTDGRARSAVGADHQGHGQSRTLADRPAQGARRRACREGGLVPGPAGPAPDVAPLLPRGPLGPAGDPSADGSRLGRLADGRRERPTAHVDREPIDGGGGAPAHSDGDRPGRGGGLGRRRRP
jgi:hypothetical protein